MGRAPTTTKAKSAARRGATSEDFDVRGRTSEASAKTTTSTGGRRAKMAIVVGEFNTEITSEMERRAIVRATELGYAPEPVLRVLGSYDLPFAVGAALARKDVVAAVAIGAIVTGDTGHDELIAHAAAHAIQDLMLRTGKPVGLAVTGPKQTYAQAEARVDRAEAGVEAAHKMLQAAASAKVRRR